MKKEEKEMKEFGKNDPEFTAIALGECSEELDASTIAEADQGAFDELNQFAATLEAELKDAERGVGLGDERIERIRESVTAKPKKKVLRFPVWFSAAAACLTMGVVTSFVIWTNKDSILIEKASVNLSTVELKEVPKNPPVPPQYQTSSRPEMDEAAPPPVPLQQLEIMLNPGHEGDGARINEMNPLVGRAYRDSDDGRSDASLGLNLSSGKRETEKVRRGQEMAGMALVSQQRTLGVAPMTLANSQHEPVSDPVYGYKDLRIADEAFNREGYSRIEENEFLSPIDSPLSTFSIDVDTASYANVRRFIASGRLPPADAVRIEELVNYFKYDYPQPRGAAPFSVTVDSASAPWKEGNRLVRVGLQGKLVSREQRPAANLVFLIDVSGSMSASNKLPLARKAMNLLVEQMGEEDRIAVVVYAGSSGLALPSTTANNKETIQHALAQLHAGGSTNGGSGITLAYDTAQRHFVKGGINRVILCTDGDFNVGISDQGALTRLIEEKAKSGVYFSAIGFGQGNYRDDMMETLSNRGNGNYAYVDGEAEARKVFVEDMLGTLLTIAKDVKIQVEFNPAKVASYRLIGYENRALAAKDFNDDKKDAGEIGSGHSVTALYEVVPVGGGSVEPQVDPLRYQSSEVNAGSPELLTVKLRYKLPEEEKSILVERPLTDDGRGLDTADDDFRFASAVAGFGLLLRESEYIGKYSMQDVVDLARRSVGKNEGGHKLDFVDLAREASELLESKQ